MSKWIVRGGDRQASSIAAGVGDDTICFHHPSGTGLKINLTAETNSFCQPQIAAFCAAVFISTSLAGWFTTQTNPRRAQNFKSIKCSANERIALVVAFAFQKANCAFG